MEVTISYPGSCGELLQGKQNGVDMLLSCPVNLFTRVTVFETNTPTHKFAYPKSQRFLDEMLSLWGYEEQSQLLDIKIVSEIPRAKGFASSTADLCAVYHCLLKLFHRPFNQQELIAATIRIEPTDSIIFDKMTAFAYKTGEVFETFGEYLSCSLLVFEGEKHIDTLRFNQSPLPPLFEIGDAFQTMKHAVQHRNLKHIAEIATQSLLANQHRLYYENLQDVLKYAQKTGGLGILGGHSGDVLGIIYDEPERCLWAWKHLEHLPNYTCYPLQTLDCLWFDE